MSLIHIITFFYCDDGDENIQDLLLATCKYTVQCHYL